MLLGCDDDFTDYHEQTETNVEFLPNNHWAFECLEHAKGIIIEHHKHYYDDVNCEPLEFLTNSIFKLFAQNDRLDAFAYIHLDTKYHYPIGLHRILLDKIENNRIVTIVLVHELLHAIHPDWKHDKINPEENTLANRACHADALYDMDILYLSGKMRFCTESEWIQSLL